MNSRESLERYYSNLLFGCGGFSNDKEELENDTKRNDWYFI